jgi:hypothetical protein
MLHFMLLAALSTQCSAFAPSAALGNFRAVSVIAAKTRAKPALLGLRAVGEGNSSLTPTPTDPQTQIPNPETQMHQSPPHRPWWTGRTNRGAGCPCPARGNPGGRPTANPALIELASTHVRLGRLYAQPSDCCCCG